MLVIHASPVHTAELLYLPMMIYFTMLFCTEPCIISHMYCTAAADVKVPVMLTVYTTVYDKQCHRACITYSTYYSV